MNEHDERSDRWFQRHPTSALVLICVPIIFAMDWLAGSLFLPQDAESIRRRHAVYHHDFVPNRFGVTRWGDTRYPVFTNSLGFRDREIREVPLVSSRRRILFMGDSFTEGIGHPFEQTFAGIVADELAPLGIEALNAAVVSYSPKLYFLKIRHLLEEVGLDFDELFVFIDISDIQDEVLYRDFESSKPWSLVDWIFGVWDDLKRHSLVAHTISRVSGEGRLPPLARAESDIWSDQLDETLWTEPFQQRRGAWTHDPGAFDAWGRQGLELAGEQMEKLAELCEKHDIPLTIAVYPWPQQLRAADPDNRQVTYWRSFAEKHGLAFLDLFPAFLDAGPPTDVYRRYFIEHDTHWNVAGHQLVARRVLEALHIR